MKLLSLYSGIGGMDLGFKQAGFDIHTAIDSDPMVLPIYKTYFSETNFILKPVEAVPFGDLRGEVVGVIGGPPCQPWSTAGHNKGLKSVHGLALIHFLKVVTDVQPEFFLMENVLGLVHMHYNVFLQLKAEYEQIGYSTEYKTLDAANYGVAQYRKRVFLYGYKAKNNTLLDDVLDYRQPTKTIRDAIGDLPSPRVTEGTALDNHEYSIFSSTSFHKMQTRLNYWDKPSRTLLALARNLSYHPDSKVMLDGIIEYGRRKRPVEQYRLLEGRIYSVRECLRLQGFPDDFVLSYKWNKHGYRMSNNAVPPPVANVLAQCIKGRL